MSLLLLALLACKGDGDTPADVAPGDDTATTAPSTGDTGGGGCDDTITWTTVGQPVLSTWCTECHASPLAEGAQRAYAPVGVDFDTLEGARQWADRIRVRAIERGDMPPATTLPDDDAELLGRWLACGAPGTEVELPDDPCVTPTPVAGDASASDLACGSDGLHLLGSLSLDADADLSCVCVVDGDVVAAGAADVALPRLSWTGGAVRLNDPALVRFSAPLLTGTSSLDVSGVASLLTLELPELATTDRVQVGDATALEHLELPELAEAGSVVIERAPALEHLELLRLTTVTGDLVLRDLPALTDLVGTNILVWVDGDLRLERLPSLVGLDEHNNVVHVGGDLVVAETGVLRVTGFQSLQTVLGGIEVRDNPLLAAVVTMPWVASVGGDLVWQSNDALETLAGFGYLSTVGGSLIVADHPVLDRWPAWSYLATVTGDLRVTDNPQLPTSAIAAAIGDVAVGGDLVVSGNGP